MENHMSHQEYTIKKKAIDELEELLNAGPAASLKRSTISRWMEKHYSNYNNLSQGMMSGRLRRAIMNDVPYEIEPY